MVLIGGGIPRETQVASQYIAQADRDGPARGRRAVSVTLLAIAFVVLLVLRLAGARERPGTSRPRRCSTTRRTRLTLRILALAYLGTLLACRWCVIFYRTFENGLRSRSGESITTPAAISAIYHVADRSSRSWCR